MVSFKVTSFLNGKKVIVSVIKSDPWDANEFLVNFEMGNNNYTRTISLKDGKWHLHDNDRTPEFGRIDINCIGFEIAKYWSSKLKRQIDEFELCF